MMELEIQTYRVKGTNITVERMTDFLWVVRKDGHRMARDGTWDYEPLPSNRSREWSQEHTFYLEQVKSMLDELNNGQ